MVDRPKWKPDPDPDPDPDAGSEGRPWNGGGSLERGSVASGHLMEGPGALLFLDVYTPKTRFYLLLDIIA